MSAQVAITQLPAAGAITGTEAVPIVQNGVTVQTTTGAIAASPSQTYQYLTLVQTPQLPNSRYIGVTNGLTSTDGGAQGLFNISTTGALLSLYNSAAGIQVKTNSSTVVNRSIAVTGAGLAITDGDGIAGNPTVALAGQVLSLANLYGNGLVTVNTSGIINSTIITGTANQISVTNGDAVAGAPTIALASNAVLPGTASMTVPIGTTAQQPLGSNGQFRFNSTTETFDGYAAGSWRQFALSGGVTTFSGGSTGLTPSTPTSGAITLGGILEVANGGTGVGTLTGYVYGNGTSAMTASTTIPFSVITGTVSVTNPLTIGTGLTGGSYDGATAVTIAIDSTVVTLTGTQTLTNKSMSGATNTFTSIPNNALVNSTISGVALGSNLNALTIGTGLSGTSYNGSGAVTIAIDSSVVTLTGTQTLTNKTIDGASNTLTNIANASLTNSSVTIGTTNIALGATSLTLGGLTSVAVTQDPVSALQVATKQYVDTLAASGIHYHDPVYVESPNTAGNLNATYNQPGGAGDGVGATLTNAGTQAALTIDGVLTTVGMRVLIYNQTNAVQNGVYTVTVVGDGSTNWVLTRATDADTYSPFSPNSLGQGDAFFVQAGNTGAGETYICNTVGTIVFGTTNITFAQISSAQIYSAGTGLTLTNTTFSITNTAVTAASYGSASSVATFTVNAQGQLTLAATTAISIDGNQITSGTVGSAYISGSYTGITGVGVLTAGTWNGNTIGVGYGGTGLASYTTGDMLYASGSTTLATLAIGTVGQVLTSTGSAPQYVAQSTLSVGSATNATNATNTAITSDATNATNYLTFVNATSGNLGQLVNSSITCNPSTGVLTGGISGGTF
jgi:trimeric autotransporter adhesin